MAERDAARSELLRRWQRAAQGPEARTDVGAAGPLSFAQERFALLEGLQPGHPAHTLRGRTDLRGPLDAARYERALGDVLQAHRGLRTRFFQDGEGRWRQQVVDMEALPLTHSATSTSDSALERALDERLAALCAAPFDLNAAPLMRLELVRVHANHHVLLSAVHHLAVDGLALLAWGRDVAERYRALGSGAPAPESPTFDPLDLARWQRTRQAAGFWKTAAAERVAELSGLPELELPADRPRPEDGASLGARCALAVDEGLREAVRQQARDLGVTPFQVYLAAFTAELHEASGQDAFAVGVPASGREHPATRGVIGYLSNSVAIASERRDLGSWSEWVRATGERAARALAAGEVPFEHLARELDPTGDRAQLARHPVFQVLFNYLDFAPEEIDAGDLRIAYRARPAGTLFDLSLYVHDRPGQGRLEFEYEALRFEAVTARRLLERVRRRLERGCSEPVSDGALRLAESADERRRRQRLEGRWIPYRRRAGGVAARVQRRAALQPDALAVAWREGAGDRAWRYADLWRRVEQWTALLNVAGLVPGDRFAWAPLSDGEAIALALALERSGIEGCALPLDLAAEHREQLARELDPRAVWLPDPRAGEWRSLWADARFLEAPAPNAPTATEAALPRDLEAPAYRLHTSGTTGRPKAVVVSRAAWVAFLDAAVARLGEVAARPWLAITPATFDIHLLERFAPLMAGGSVELVDPDEARSGERLAARLERARPGAFQATPSTHRLLELAGYEGDGEAHWLIGGEAWYPGLAERAHAEAGGVWNAYGPTEATVWVSLTRLLPGDPVHLGRPLRGTAWRVADSRGTPAPLGAPGELWLCGPQLAEGYAGDPARTDESFPNVDGRRWYRTGDRVRFDAAGRLLHLGRDDDQIKLRGHRLELGAVESALESLENVAAAAVAFDSEAPEGGALVALLVPGANAAELPASDALDGWRTVWSHVFEREEGPGAGWIDPDRGRPFEPEALGALARGFVERVLGAVASPADARVLEVGAGGGLIAGELAGRVARLVVQEPDAAARARLAHLPSIDRVLGGRFGDLGDELEKSGPYDAIVLHSVVQYLGSTEHLIAGLDELRGALSARGCLVLGDLLAPDEHGRRPEELAIDPGSWERWAAAEPGVLAVEVRPRRRDERFAAAPELLRGRYDVILRFGGTQPLGCGHLEALGAAFGGSGASAPSGDLRRALAGRLPQGQIPAAHAWAKELPRTSAGKLDRRAVVRAVRSRTTPIALEDADERFAGDPLAAALASIWQEVVGQPAEPGANFFEAGGHSLSAARFAALARERIPRARDLELADLLRWPRFGELLAHLEGTSGEAPDRAAGDPLSLSPAQQRLLVLEALDPGLATYHLAFELRGAGRVEPARMRGAFEFLRERHRALRLAVTGAAAPRSARWSEVDAELPLESLPESAAWVPEPFAALPFDLEGGAAPLWRARWQPTSKGWRLVWVLHHLIADARSVAVLSAELTRWLAGRNLEEPRADFEALQRSAQRSAGADSARTATWAEAVRPCALPLEWPASFAPSEAPARGAPAAVLELPLAPERAAHFARLGAELGVGTHALLLALVGEWLRGLTGGSRFCLGTTLGGRDREALADAVGFAASTVAVPLDLEDSEPGVPGWVERAGDAWQAALEHADVGFEALVAELAPERDRERPPVFQVAVDHLGGTELGRWESLPEVELREVAAGPAKFEITVQWIEAEGSRVRFEFDVRRFDEPARERLVTEFDRRLAGWLDSPSDAPPVEEAAASIEVDSTGGSLLQRLEARAAAQPETLAWKRGAHGRTYSQLLERRRRWSAALADAGVRPGQRVGVALEDPGEFALALWALWALGATPVSVQASDATARRDERLRAAACAGCVGAGADAWSLEQLDRGAAATPAELGAKPPAHSEALVLFTSGTSGRPKAVRIGHASLGRYLDWAAERYDLARGAVAFTDPAFDLGLTCALGPWWCGGTLRTGEGDDPLERLESCLDSEGTVGALKLTPTHLRALATSGLASRLDGRVRHLIVGGERLDHADLEPWRGLQRPPRLHNEYGPTEATVAVCAFGVDLETAARRSAGPIPVGAGDTDFVDGVRWRIVDERGRPVTPGTPGELWLAGTPLALGYDDAAATGQAFVQRAGRRWYRTGDRAIETSPGLVILGRTDAQLKVRGVRVDPEELEQRLGSLPGVEAVAVDLRATSDSAELIAFCVGSGELPPDPGTLAERLPRSLWPDRWQTIDRLPTRGHGKLDRVRLARLPLQAVERAAPGASLGWPPHPLSEVLRDQLGDGALPELDFFANGGDSIAALTVSARARQLGWELSVASLFEADSLHRALATARRTVGQEFAAIGGPRGLTPAQANYAAGLTDPTHWDVQALAVELSEPRTLDEVQRALDALVERHGALRTAFRRDGRGWTQEELPAGDAALEALPRDRWEAEAPRAFAGLDLAEGKLLGALFDENGRGVELLIYAHHLAVDAQSWRLLLQDFEALLDGRPGDVGAPVPASAFSPEPDAAAQAEALRFPFGTEGDARRVRRTLSAERLERYARIAERSALPPVDQALAAAFAATLEAHFGVAQGMHLESQGRRAPGEAAAAGFFSEWLAVDTHPGDAFDGDPSAALRAVTHSRWLARPAREGHAAALLNHLGRWRAPGSTKLAVQPFDGAPWRSPGAPLRAGHELRSSERDGRWELEWISASGHDAADLERAWVGFLERFEALLVDLERRPSAALSPAAFGLPGDADDWRRWSAREAAVLDVAPLTPTQLGMLLEPLERPGSAAYREQFWLELAEGLEPARVEAALTALADKHDALRSVFAWRGLARPVRVVRGRSELHFEVLDARGLDVLERDAQWDRRLALGRAGAWDLDAAPPWRVVLQRRSDRSTRLLFEYHHLLLDGWSLPTLLGDLERALRGGDLARRTSPQRFAEPGEARDSRPGANTAEARAYWDARFAGFEAPPQRLAGERAEQATPDPHRVHRQQLTRDQSRAIEERARLAGATPALLLQAAWARVLQRFGGRRDTAFALTQSGREASDLDARVGAFLRTVAVRVPEAWRDPEHGCDPWSAQDLAAWRADAAERAPHEALALARQLAVLEERPERVLESLLVFENYPRPGAAEDDGRPRWIDAGGFERTPFPLTWIAVPGERWSLELCADASRVAAPLHRALFEALLEEVRAIAPDPRRWERALGVAPPATVDAEDRLWAGLRQGGERALWVAGQRQWTANEVARAVARRQGALEARGVQPGDVVAVDLGDPVERALALLGVWATGAAPWTVDRDDSEDRRSRAARWAAPKVWIGDRAASLDGPVLSPSDFDAGAPRDPVGSARSGPLGALAFTSGSTGDPKGIELPRAAFFAKAHKLAERYGWRSGDELPAFAAAGFDTAYEELLGSLFAGARLHFDAELRELSFQELEERLTRDGWTLLDLPTAYWNAWALERAVAERPAGARLRQVVVGGQAVDPRAWEAWRRRWPEVEVLNSYGPTETTIVSVAGELSSEEAAPPSIGRPLPGVEVELRSDSGDDPRCGELTLGDPAARTAERRSDGRREFGASQPYRTGDWVLRDEQARLRFLGRRDAQVKLRGHRVELEEIEGALGRVGIAARAALDAAGRLAVGYLGDRAPERVTERLRQALPAWMQPAYLAPLADWPRTPRGKLDRTALATAVRRAARALEAPANASVSPAVEDPWLARARTDFAEALGLAVEDVAADSRLEELGGDSLSALTIASRAAGDGGTPRMAALLDEPTPSGWARELERILASAGQPGDTDDPGATPKTAAECAAWASADPAWRFTPIVPGGQPGVLLITGATGLLGAHVTAEVARSQPDRSIAVAVRGASDEDARRRWEQRWEEVRGELPLDRVEVWRGDLAKPRFGWGWELSNERRARVDQVVHSAASTSPTAPLEQLLRDNVESTRRLVEWLAGEHPAQLHALSTLGLFEGLAPRGEVWDERTPLSELGAQSTPYPASKWCAELLLENARAAGLDVTLLRPGRLLPEWNERHRDPWAAALAEWASESRALLAEDLELDARPARAVAGEVARALAAGGAGVELPPVLHLDDERPWNLSEGLEAWLAGRPDWRRFPWPELAERWRPIAQRRGEAGLFAALEGLASRAAAAPERVGNRASRQWLRANGGAPAPGSDPGFWAEMDADQRP